MIRKTFLRLCFEEDGITAVELALLTVLFFVPLLLGVTELGHRIWVKAQLDTAARAGIDYAILHGMNTSGITTAATSATRLTVTATSSLSCGCPTSTGMNLNVTCGSTCSNGGTTGNYVSVTTAASYTPLFHSCGGLLPATVCPLTHAAISLSSTAGARIN